MTLRLDAGALARRHLALDASWVSFSQNSVNRLAIGFLPQDAMFYGAVHSGAVHSGAVYSGAMEFGVGA